MDIMIGCEKSRVLRELVLVVLWGFLFIIYKLRFIFNLIYVF